MTRTALALMIATMFATAASAQTAPPAQQATPPAQTPAPAPQVPAPFPADARIAVVDMQSLLSGSKLGQAGVAQLKALTDKRDADLQAKSQAIQALQQQIQQQATVLSPASRTEKQNELDRLQREGQFASQDWDVQVQNLQQQLLSDFESKVQPIIESVRVEKHLWVILSIADSGAAAWNRDLDLSGEIIRQIDAKFPAGK
jgi:outer membrane protein